MTMNEMEITRRQLYTAQLVEASKFKVGDRVRSNRRMMSVSSAPGTIYKVLKTPEGHEVHVKHDDGQDLRYDPKWLLHHKRD